MGDIVQARAVQSVVREQGDGFMQLTAIVFEIGGGTPHLGDQPLEQLGNRFPCPRIGHRHPDTVDVAQSGAPDSPMMMGIQGQHGHDLARAQANTDIDHPDQPLVKAGTRCPRWSGRVDAHDGESEHPIDDSLRTRCLMDAQWPQPAESAHVRPREMMRASKSYKKWTTSTLGRMVVRPTAPRLRTRVCDA